LAAGLRRQTERHRKDDDVEAEYARRGWDPRPGLGDGRWSAKNTQIAQHKNAAPNRGSARFVLIVDTFKEDCGFLGGLAQRTYSPQGLKAIVPLALRKFNGAEVGDGSGFKLLARKNHQTARTKIRSKLFGRTRSRSREIERNNIPFRIANSPIRVSMDTENEAIKPKIERFVPVATCITAL